MKISIRFLCACVFSAVLYSPLLANDSAASIGAGGLVFKREARISMQKERLFISLNKVTVDYDFLNETDADITTEVAFPLPAVNCIGQEFCPANIFDDFRASADGKAVTFSTDLKALLSGHDYAELLRQMHVDIAAFAHVDPTSGEEHSRDDVGKLTKAQQTQLVNLGLLSNDGGLCPRWTVEKTYYWSQTFPAHRTVHISHEYKPASGSQYVRFEDLDPAMNERQIRENADELFARAIRDSCFDAPLLRSLKKGLDAERARHERPNGYMEYSAMVWVNYILKTANSWKTPIKDFSLILEKPAMIGSWHWYVSLCWDGKIERVDEGHLIAHAVNFVPKNDLNIAFITVEPQP